MASTKRSMNTTAVSMASQAITGVTNFAYDAGGSLIKFSGDGDRYPTTVVNDFSDPSFSLTTADMAAARACTPGLRGVFTATINDAKNGISAGGGGYTVSTSSTGGVVMTNSATQAHRQFGSATISIAVESSDGITNPVSFTAL